MKKVFQTIVDKGDGNCMQAAIASLLNKNLDEVPHFLRNKKNGITDERSHIIMYFWKNGFPEATTVLNSSKKRNVSLKKIAKFDGGINGYFYASVPSKTFSGLTHAVIVNTDLKVVHDPNPNQLHLDIKPKEINYIICVNDFIISENNELIKGENYENKY